MTRKLNCRICAGRMQKWGRSKQGKQRFYCIECKKSATPQRNDVEIRKDLEELGKWLLGKNSLSEIAAKTKITRQALWKRFNNIIHLAEINPVIPDLIQTTFLIVGATYIHGNKLCVLIAIDENDKLYWRFVDYESYDNWCKLLASFTEPEIIIMDGQKGLFAAAKSLWPKVAIQRCQFHVIAFCMQYIGRRPKEAIGIELMEVLYDLNPKIPRSKLRGILGFKYKAKRAPSVRALLCI